MNTRSFEQIAADVRLAQGGDAEAMNRIIEDVQDMVYYNCLKILKSEQAAQDATQDVLIAVYQKIGTLTEPQAYFGWVKRITANQCKLQLRKGNREFLLHETEEGEDPFANFEDTDEQRIPDKALDNEETRRMIVDLIDKLPDEQRMCVMLFYYDEMKTREIAETLQVSEGTIKSRLNYARKAIKEGVQAYEKQGIKLYGLSPIPFIGYFLGKAAASVSAPITASAIASAATVATATATATTATATTAATAGGLATFAATAVGKVVIGIAAAVVLGGAVTGTVIAVEKSEEAKAVIAEVTEEPTLAPTVVPTEAPTVAPTTELTPEPEPTAEPTPEPTPEPETPEETLERLLDIPELEASYILECLRRILAGENDAGYVTDSPVVEVREEHSVAAYKAFRLTKAWTEDVPESELPCYGARLENGVGLYMYLGDGLPTKDGVIEHEWVIYRVRFMDSDEYLLKLDYLEGPQWTTWSTELPPENAVKVESMIGYRGRWTNGFVNGSYGLYGPYHVSSEEEFEAKWHEEYARDYAVLASKGFTESVCTRGYSTGEWNLLSYDYDSIPQDEVSYDFTRLYRGEWNEEKGKYTVWAQATWLSVQAYFYTPWSNWYASEEEIPEKYERNEDYFINWLTESATLYRYSRR